MPKNYSTQPNTHNDKNTQQTTHGKEVPQIWVWQWVCRYNTKNFPFKKIDILNLLKLKTTFWKTQRATLEDSTNIFFKQTSKRAKKQDPNHILSLCSLIFTQTSWKFVTIKP